MSKRSIGSSIQDEYSSIMGFIMRSRAGDGGKVDLSTGLSPEGKYIALRSLVTCIEELANDPELATFKKSLEEEKKKLIQQARRHLSSAFPEELNVALSKADSEILSDMGWDSEGFAAKKTLWQNTLATGAQAVASSEIQALWPNGRAPAEVAPITTASHSRKVDWDAEEIIDYDKSIASPAGDSEIWDPRSALDSKSLKVRLGTDPEVDSLFERLFKAINDKKLTKTAKLKLFKEVTEYTTNLASVFTGSNQGSISYLRQFNEIARGYIEGQESGLRARIRRGVDSFKNYIGLANDKEILSKHGLRESGLQEYCQNITKRFNEIFKLSVKEKKIRPLAEISPGGTPGQSIQTISDNHRTKVPTKSAMKGGRQAAAMEGEVHGVASEEAPSARPKSRPKVVKKPTLSAEDQVALADITNQAKVRISFAPKPVRDMRESKVHTPGKAPRQV